MKKNAAFSLLELLVVIAIIGILASLISAAVGGLRGSAQEQHCRNNLKQLHDAFLAYGMRGADGDGNLPMVVAQYYDICLYGGVEPCPQKPWVQVVPLDGKEKTLLAEGEKFRTESRLDKFCNDLGTGESARFAITHGGLYPFIEELTPYACPVMQAQVRERARLAANNDDDESTAGSLKIYRTYAMNAFFGCADSDFNRAFAAFSNSAFFMGKIGKKPAKIEGPANYPLVKDSYAPFHRPVPAKLLLFTEIVPSYQNNKTVPRTSSGSSGSFKAVPVRGGDSSSDCCINPATIDDEDERIGYDCNWDKYFSPKGANPKPDSEQGYKYGVHPTGVRKPLSNAHGKSVEIMGSLAVFMDGHIEKVFANTDGDEDGKNTAWYYNHGYEPSNTMPTGRNTN